MTVSAILRSLGAAVLAVAALPLPGAALEPVFPGPAVATATQVQPMASFRLPLGPWTAEGVPVRVVEGRIEARAWRVEVPGQATLALLAPLRDQLAAQGWQVIFDCETRACGGFDFRYGIDTLPEPDMHVDLGDFRFLSAERATAAGPEVLALMVSRSSNAGYVQITRAGPAGATPAAEAAEAPAEMALPAAAPVVADGIGAALIAAGHAVLEDLVFASGAATLTDGDYPSLAALAGWLGDNPAARVALVGHTDAAGGLETNIVLSRRRAESVRARLLALGVAPVQVEAQGVGYLAPRDTSLTEDGRTRNRRVEVVLTAAP